MGRFDQFLTMPGVRAAAPRRLNPLSGIGSGASTPARFSGGFATPQPNNDIGKATIDITDPVGSLFGVLGSLGGLAGGILGGVGEVGIPGGPQIKNVAQPLADIATKNPVASAIGGTISGAFSSGGPLGKILEPVIGPGQSIEEIEARKRLEAAQAGGRSYGKGLFETLGDLLSGKPFDAAATYAGASTSAQGDPTQRAGLPADILARLDAGESIDKLAEDLTNRGEGFSSNVTVELAKGILNDPWNVVGPLLGTVSRGITLAGRAVKAAETVGKVAELDRTTLVAGRTYNLVAGGLSKARAATVRTAIGPITSGALHHFGIANYTGLKSALSKANPAYAATFDNALSVGNGALVRAVMGERIGSFYRGVLRTIAHTAEDIRGRLPSVADLETEVAGALTAARAEPGGLEKSIQRLIARVAPDFATLTDAELAESTARRLAAITGQSVEDAARTLGDKVPIGQAQLIHLAYYGRAVDDLVSARNAIQASGKAANIDYERLTLVAPGTLDVDAAKALRANIAAGDDMADAVKQYDVLAERFFGKTFTEKNVDDLLAELLDNDALPQLVKAPTTGANPLPKELSDWRVKYAREESYKLGFAPESGWKAIIRADGEVIVTDPFVFLQGTREAVSVRNPIGRFADSLMRGVSQEIIILEGTARSVRFSNKLKTGLAPNKARGIFRSVLYRAAEEKVAPRGLVKTKGVYHVLDDAGKTITRQGNAIDEMFDRILTPAEMTDLFKVTEPTVLMMTGLEGNWNRVGLTQKFTGAVKTRAQEARLPVSHIAEVIYPDLRFTLNPFFQLQEFIESPFWNKLRGIKNANVSKEVQDAYNIFANDREFKLIAEAGHVTNIWGAEVANQVAGKTTLIGKAMARFTGRDIAGTKASLMKAQRFAEHGAEFEAQVNKVSPRIWQTMTEAYGTTDANEIARRFITERLQITQGRVDDAMKAAGVTRAAGMSADEATVLEAWRESFERVSNQAFKTHFFAPERGWLERTLNHPYLGLYPLSYMWGKVLPEFARFLLLKPFGLNAPLVGYAAMQRVQQAMIVWAANPANAKALEDHADFIYLVELLLPGQPTDLPTNAPSWARHIVRDASAGKTITSEMVGREVRDIGATLFNKPISGLDLGLRAGGELVGGDLLGNLQKAAGAYDEWFPPTKF